MAFSTSEIEEIRLYLGFDRLFLASNPYLDSVLQAIQSTADHGSAPDSTTENLVRAKLQQVVAIDGYIFQILSEPTNIAVTEIPTGLTNNAVLKQDYKAALRALRKNGTDCIQAISIAVGLKPLRFYFYSDGQQGKASDFWPRFFVGQNR